MKHKSRKGEVVFSTGDEALSTLGEELRQKYPEMMEKFARLQGSDPVVRRLVDTIQGLMPYEWQDSDRFYEGAMHCVRGNYLGALGAFSEIMEEEPEAYPVFHLLGYVCGSMGKHKMEVDYYRKAIKIKPDYPQVYYDLALAYWMLGKENKANGAFKQALMLNQDFAVADHWLTFASDHLGRYLDPDGLGEKEEGEKERCLAWSYYLLGMACLDFDLNTHARSAFKNAVKLQEDFADAYYQLGSLHIKKLRNPKRARKYLETAEALYSRSGDTGKMVLAHQLYTPVEEVESPERAAEDWLKEGLRLQQLGYYQSAIDAYKKVVAFQPNDVEAYYNMGIAYGSLEDLGQRKIDSAIGALKHAVRLKPDFIHAHIALGAAYIRKGEFMEAVALLEETALLAPRDYNVFYYLGTAMRMMGQIDQSLSALEKAVSLAPDSVHARFSLGLAYYDSKRLELARDEFLETVRIRPDFADAHYLLGSLFHAALEDAERSMFHLRKAEKLYVKLRDYPKIARVRELMATQPV
ncbi:MAG: tetratricopeptide repeat protein [Nitrospinaceae bacterium]|nr:tetratricopeptide repeat protein [Nitrospinaceae bacterium]NIR54276.1 tetratricopeptide repeat protein [Nitrospinaceae bacterium]NIS84693.1 tetratricopeptide repeat protein [Nitrospinaceae bacterium]NIT81488.1 tetratricopeptide repeat protein [Nitrospinaceae bacterium]NIU43772.1 tetratricopeptide repeat protein [Nitrospinaceae bacterium]